ncbi:phosphatase PAP2 family protein [Ectobacillus polymachus]|uniref:phosphatase PAP2 family protein n=1 Tax=Ectobacillus polymachus TaxID=1508806 RepID=UPI003A899FDB
MSKSISALYEIECHIFKRINRYFERKALNMYFRTITHMGGATFLITAVIVLLLFSKGSLRQAVITSAISLTISHIPVQLLKKLYPRKRPYLMVDGTKYPINPLKDHSFPSGHTTAIFSVVVPLLLYMPVLTIILAPIALSVGISRIYLGLHYPSDVLAGLCLGTLTGIISYYQFSLLF